MKIENQLTKNVKYYTLIYREVGLLQHTPCSVSGLEGEPCTNVKQTAPKKATTKEIKTRMYEEDDWGKIEVKKKKAERNWGVLEKVANAQRRNPMNDCRTSSFQFFRSFLLHCHLIREVVVRADSNAIIKWKHLDKLMTHWQLFNHRWCVTSLMVYENDTVE